MDPAPHDPKQSADLTPDQLADFKIIFNAWGEEAIGNEPTRQILLNTLHNDEVLYVALPIFRVSGDILSTTTMESQVIAIAQPSLQELLDLPANKIVKSSGSFVENTISADIHDLISSNPVFETPFAGDGYSFHLDPSVQTQIFPAKY